MGSVIYDYCMGGWYSKIELNLIRQINLLARRGGFHQYVGIASDPEHRWKSYHHKNGWGDMYVIYQSSSWDRVKHVETRLEEHLTGKTDHQWWAHGYAHNQKPGGGGRRPTKRPPYYVYILNAPKFNRFAYEFTYGS